MGARCVRAVRRSVRRRDSRVVGFWSEAAVSDEGALEAGGVVTRGPRVNDHRKPMCVTSRGQPYSVAYLLALLKFLGVYARLALLLLFLSRSLSFFFSLSFSFFLSLSIFAIVPSPSTSGEASQPKREKEREPTLPISTTTDGSAGDHFSCLTSVMKRFLPSSFTLPIYRFNYRLVARRSRSREILVGGGYNEKISEAGPYGDVKSDLICRTAILIDDKRFVRAL